MLPKYVSRWNALFALAFASSLLVFMTSSRVAGAVWNDDDKAKSSHGAGETSTDETPCELGLVQWQRDLEHARQSSSATGKPILVLFQEVPGCQTCQDFGNQPLSHPLMVEAIEDLFLPVLVYNNKPSDEKTLAAFDEPSWNNPVVRYLDAEGKDVIPRRDRVWETAPMAQRMVQSLRAAGREVPGWLELLAREHVAQPAKATFAMHCYWEGEAKLGQLDGVSSTRSAWVGDKEVVEVAYDAAKLNYAHLLSSAQAMDCASVVYVHDQQQHEIAREHSVDQIEVVDQEFTTRDAKLSDQRYYLRNSMFRHLPLTDLQSVKINALLSEEKGSDAVHELLSPRQQKLQKAIEERLSDDPHALASFVFPDRGVGLVQYHDRLVKELGLAD